MGFCGRASLLVAIIVISYAYNQFHHLAKPLKAPVFDTNQYWGPGSPAAHKDNTEKILQEVQYTVETIDRLQKRLNETLALHDPLEGIGFEYGVNSKKVHEIVAYWRDDYLPRWISREQRINLFPHYITEVQGLKIHYIHTKVTYETKGRKVVPLLLLHGWPGSVIEFYDILQKLNMPNDELDVLFEVVVPSLPGFGWSQAAAKPGFGVAQMSVVLRNLMLQLGYDKFYIQGGDWGSALGSTIATLFPENVIGYHSNLCFINTALSNIKSIVASMYTSAFIDQEYTDFVFPPEKYQNLILETGYFHLQATKPDTIGIALTANPVGLAVYILEKFSTWTNPAYRNLPDGGFSKNDFELDAMLDNIMIYYLTNSITTSVRLYSEAYSAKHRGYQLDRVPTDVPTGCARFKHDLAHSLDWQLEDKYTNLVHSTYHWEGGHFAAMQLPDVLYDDFIQFVQTVRRIEKYRSKN